jgi:solute carrier family 50 protein (sugar transporter)
MLIMSPFSDLCGALGPLFSMTVFAAPIPTMQQIKHDRTVGQLPLLPYSSMAASAYLWTMYGLMKHQPNIWGTNVVGLAFAVYYWQFFTKFLPKTPSPTLPGSVEQHMQGCGVIILASTMLYLAGTPLAAEVVGKAAVVLCVAMFASPLAALKVVLETKSAKAIPLPFTIASILNCFCWSVFGVWSLNDPNVYFPNILGLAFGLSQLILKLVYGNGTHGAESVLPA